MTKLLSQNISSSSHSTSLPRPSRGLAGVDTLYILPIHFKSKDQHQHLVQVSAAPCQMNKRKAGILKSGLRMQTAAAVSPSVLVQPRPHPPFISTSAPAAALQWHLRAKSCPSCLSCSITHRQALHTVGVCHITC